MPFFHILILSPRLELSFLLVECKLICYVPLPFFLILIPSPRLELGCLVPSEIGALQASLTNLGVTPHCHLTMKAHKFNLLRSANFEPRRISATSVIFCPQMPKLFLSLSAIVLTRFVCCNFLLSACPQYLLLKLQKRLKTTLLAVSLEFPKLTIINVLSSSHSTVWYSSSSWPLTVHLSPPHPPPPLSRDRFGAENSFRIHITTYGEDLRENYSFRVKENSCINFQKVRKCL